MSGETKCDKLGTVIGFFDNGIPKIKFDGEDKPSEKQYPYLSGYVPKLNDVVFLKEFNASYIIMGGILHEVTPPNEFNIMKKELDKKVNKSGDIMEGKFVAKPEGDVAQVRNIVIVQGENRPSSSDIPDGAIGVVFK